MDDTIVEVVHIISGGAGIRGMDAVRLQHWILWFGEACAYMRQVVASFTEPSRNILYAHYACLLCLFLVEF